MFRWMASFSSLFLTACSTTQYLTQAARGQLALIHHARPIREAILDERIPPRTQALLKEVEAIKKYSEVRGLKATSNYEDYVALDRSAAVWVVSACKELSFEEKIWKFPIVGAVPYLGWFDLVDAKNFAEKVRAEGWEVDVRGAAAYSTLGWFKDAVLSSMIESGDDALGSLVNVVIHESVHATVYVKDQSPFNESLATFVADAWTLDFLRERAAEGLESPEYRAYVEAENLGKKRVKRLHEAFEHLNSLYGRNDVTDEFKREEKSNFLKKLKAELGWKRELNNATLAQFRVYHHGGEFFQKVFDRCGKDWARFLKKMREVSSRHFPASQSQEWETLSTTVLKNCD
jgi:predicted aminopeptidase